LILYTGEEVGLIGSHHFLAHGPIHADQIVANLNLDMIGRTAPENRENRAHYVVSEDGEEAPLSQLVGRVNAQTVGWPLVFADQADFPGGSDHQSFAARGIPAVFFFSGHHRDLHRPTDDANRIEYDKVQALSRLVHEIVMELGNADFPLR
jgi:Zn-dependent M28 family amino/carboxypeptidase